MPPRGISFAHSRGMAKTKRTDTVIGSDPHAAPRSSDSPSPADLDRERVALRAYELYLARGGVDGQAMEDWLIAERRTRQRKREPVVHGEPVDKQHFVEGREALALRRRLVERGAILTALIGGFRTFGRLVARWRRAQGARPRRLRLEPRAS